MLEIRPSRSGPPTAFWNSTALHSEYDPVKEAKRFAANHHVPQGALIILMDPGLGYVVDALKELHPEARFIIFCFHPHFYSINRAKADAWFEDCGSSIEAFLADHISDDDLSTLTVIEWQPTLRAFPESAREISIRILQFVRERQGSLLTDRFFGRRWIRNSLKNFLHLENLVSIEKAVMPVVVAASGASLNRTIDLLGTERKRYLLLALPSSLEALAHNGIFPDFIALTDAGHYSAEHLACVLRDTVRGFSSSRFIMPLSAVPFVYRTGNPVQLIDQNAFYEKAFLARVAYKAIECPSNGTVAGSALEFAARITGMPIVFTGLDFCTEDIRTHVRPHAFEHYDRDGANRTAPHYSRTCGSVFSSYPDRDMKTGMRFTPSLRTYAGWFSVKTGRGNLYRLAPSGIQVDALIPVDGKGFREILDTCGEGGSNARIEEHRIVGVPRTTRKRIAFEVLAEWREGLRKYVKTGEYDRSFPVHEFLQLVQGSGDASTEGAEVFIETLEREVRAFSDGDAHG